MSTELRTIQNTGIDEQVEVRMRKGDFANRTGVRLMHDGWEWGTFVAVDDDGISANTDFIVRACNSHAAMLEALKAAENQLTAYDVQNFGTITETTKAARAAIAKAERGEGGS
ncbi:MAG: hypothetical protein WC683_05920 [bacterium]